MPEIEEILDKYDYAETIEVSVAGGEVTAVIAESHPIRNPLWSLLTSVAMKRLEIEDYRLVPNEEKIKIFCQSVLKSWNVTSKGKPLEPKNAADFLVGRAGDLLFRDLATLSADPKNFHGVSSKKKASSTRSRKTNSSEKKPGTSRARPKRVAKKSQSASKTTSTA